MLLDSSTSLPYYTGFILIAYVSIRILFYAIRLVRRQFPPNLIKRFGANSWAVITGSTDGIGKSFAERLALRGFNIVLVSRNKEKLETVASQIRKSHPSILLKIVVADFNNSSQQGFFDKIFAEIKDLDVSILVNNVGLFFMEHFDLVEESTINNLLNVNIFPVVMLTKKFINQFKVRKPKSAIVNISSTSRGKPAPYVNVYAATKGFIAHFSESLALEFPEIDVFTVGPHYVTSSMTLGKNDFETITADQAAEGALRELGRYKDSACHIKHEIAEFLIKNAPSVSLINSFIKSIYFKMEIDRRHEIQDSVAGSKKKI